jgi:heat shock protein HtpX
MAYATAGLQTHIWNNNLRSMIVLAVYPMLILVLTWACAFILIGSMQDFTGQTSQYGAGWPGPEIARQTTNLVILYAPLIIGILCGWFVISYFFHETMIRKLSGAHKVARTEEPELYNLLENLCIAQGVPMPALNIIETHGRNAFASGINEKTFTITVTRGLMNSLQKDELEAVLAHELSHIMHRDVRLMVIALVFTGMVALAFQLVANQMRYGFYLRSSSSSRGGKNAGAIIFVMLAILAVLGIGYLLTSFMRYFISRKREYMADAGAVDMTKNPEAMMRALMRITGRDRMPNAKGDIAMMYIENSRPLLGLFSTHPPIENRIEAIALINNIPVPEIKSLGPADQSEQLAHDRTPKAENPWLIRRRHG